MSIIRSKGDMEALAARRGAPQLEDKDMTDVPNDAVAPGESVRVTLDGVNENGERISRVIAEWYGMPNDEANIFSMAMVEAVGGVADKFRQVKAEQSGPRPGNQPPGQMLR